jgi:hypothetical protein
MYCCYLLVRSALTSGSSRFLKLAPELLYSTTFASVSSLRLDLGDGEEERKRRE